MKEIQTAFIAVLSDPDGEEWTNTPTRHHPFFNILQDSLSVSLLFLLDLSQDVASKGLGLVYEMGGEADQQTLVSTLVETLMTGKRSVSGEVNGWRNKVRELQEVEMYSEHIPKILFYF